MGTSDTKWPVFGIRITDANFRPDPGSVSSSCTDRGLKAATYETLCVLEHHEKPSQIVSGPSKYDVHWYLPADRAQTFHGRRRTVLVPVHQLEQHSQINTQT